MAIYGANSADQLGYSVSYAGDVNNDGIEDIIIGASGWQSNQGIVYVIYGSKTPPAEIDLSLGLSSSQGFAISGEAGSLLGVSVSSAGDINNDGIGDLIIGAFGSNLNGAAYVIFGQKGTRNDIDLALGLDSTEGFVILGEASEDYLGMSVSYAGDVDGDGIEDIVLGAYGNNGRNGAVYVIYGQEGSSFSTVDLSQGLSQTEGFMIKGKSTAQLGFMVGSAGDFNGDGKADVLMGAPGENSMYGGAYVIFGGDRSLLTEVDLSSGLSSSRGVRIVNSNSQSFLGYSTKGAGDINGDGICDVLVAAPFAESTAGVVYVIFGSKELESEIDLSNGLGAQEGFRIIGGKSGDMLGTFAIGVGDMNGDGLGDMLIGAYTINIAYLVFSPTVCPENCETCEGFSTCEVCETGYGLYESECYEECPDSTELVNGVCTAKTSSSTIETVTQVAKGVFDSGSIASRIFTMGRSLSVSLGLMAKIIQNVRYLDIDYPEEALNAFENYGTDLFELPLPEVFDKSSSDAKELPERYSKYDLDPTFLENYWQTMMMTLISLVCFLLIKLVRFMTKSTDKGSMFQVALKNVGQTAANFTVIQIYSSFDDVIFFSLLDVGSTKMSSFSAGLSLGVGSMFLILGFALVCLHFWVLGKYQKAKEQDQLERFQEKFRILGTLYEDFKDDNAVKQSFFGILILRCVFLVLVMMLLQPPWIQASLLMLANLIFLGYFIYQRPFKNLFDEISQYFCELTIFAAYLSVLVLSILDYKEDGSSRERNGFGKCIVIAGIVLSLGGFIIQVIQIIGALYGIYQFFKEGFQKKQQRVPISKVLDNKKNEAKVLKQKKLKNKTQLSESSQIELKRNFTIPEVTENSQISRDELDVSWVIKTDNEKADNEKIMLKNKDLVHIEALKIKVAQKGLEGETNGLSQIEDRTLKKRKKLKIKPRISETKSLEKENL